MKNFIWELPVLGIIVILLCILAVTKNEKVAKILDNIVLIGLIILVLDVIYWAFTGFKYY